VLSTLVTLLHIYVFVRADSLPICKRWIGRKSLIGSGAALWLIFSLSRIYGGHEYGLLTVVLEAVGMHWMATAVIFGHGTGELIDFWSNELGRFRR